MVNGRKVLLRITDLKQHFPVKGKKDLFVKANDGISMDIYEGETFGLVGESGCGKSTLGRTILQLYPQTHGKTIYYGRNLGEALPGCAIGEADNSDEGAFCDGGIDLSRLKQNEMRLLRRDLQLVFQDPYSSLNPRMTVGQIIGEGLLAHKVFDRVGQKMQDYIMEVMENCGIAPYMIHRYPHQFSGGQRQRIAIARSLALRPKFVVCDEAVSALDVSIQSQILNLLSDLKEKENLTYLFISHDLSVIRYISDRIGVMYLGNLMELASVDDLFGQPMHPYTDALLKAIPTTTVDNPKSEVILEGDIPSPITPPKGCKFHTRCRYATDICEQIEPIFEEAAPGHHVACHHKLGSRD